MISEQFKELLNTWYEEKKDYEEAFDTLNCFSKPRITQAKENMLRAEKEIENYIIDRLDEK